MKIVSEKLSFGISKLNTESTSQTINSHIYAELQITISYPVLHSSFTGMEQIFHVIISSSQNRFRETFY